MAAYNEEDVIWETFRGIRQQNYPNRIDVIVVDDGSTDDTVEILKKCKYDNLKIVHAKHGDRLDVQGQDAPANAPDDHDGPDRGEGEQQKPGARTAQRVPDRRPGGPSREQVEPDHADRQGQRVAPARARTTRCRRFRDHGRRPSGDLQFA